MAALPPAALPRRKPIAPGQLLIGGRWVNAEAGETMDVMDPTTEASITHVQKGGAADTAKAIDAACAAFEDGPWGRMRHEDRAKILFRMADLMDERAEDVAIREAMDMGMPYSDFRTIIMPHCSGLFRFYAGQAMAHMDGGYRTSYEANIRILTRREPLGVVGAITPWNFPLALTASKVAPGLAADNCIIHKPASDTPLTALALAQVALDAGVPEGAYNLITGPGGAVGDALVRSRKVDKIAFTGSTAVGIGLIRNGADTIKHQTMELGGKSPNIIFADADMQAALQAAFWGIFWNKGEVCVAGSRILVERAIYDEFVEKFSAMAQAAVLGDPLDPTTQLGPIATRAEYDKIIRYIDAGRQSSARLTAGGNTPKIGGKGLFIEATVFADATNDLKISREEIFGPVVPIIPFEGEDEAIRLANDTDYGLASGIQTSDLGRALRLADRIKAGTVWLNTWHKCRQGHGAEPVGDHHAPRFHACEKRRNTSTMPAPQKSLRRPLVMAAVIAGMFMIAIEATIVATAMPQIASQLGDLHLYAWVFSAFLLTQTATTVVFGKLADIYGRKPVILIGIGIFLVGSALCGLAWSMPALIVFRLLQGTGAGAIQPVCLTIVGDMYTAEQRGKIQGYLASVWGVTAVLGPLVGGLIIQHFDWAWIFWINIPVGLAACGGFIAFLHETRSKSTRQVDVAGAILFAIAVASLMVAFTEIGTSTRSTAIATLIFIASTVLFAFQERRAADPMLELSLWARRPIATANAVVLFASMAIIGLTAFLPIYVQVVLNRSALVAGFTLTMLILGWPIGTTVAARNFARFGLRRTLLCGAALLPAGGAVFPLLGPGTSPVLAALGSSVMGFGMGLLSVSAIVIIQESSALHERGVATASNIFARNLGSTLGATVLGGVLNSGLSYAASEKIDFDQVRHLLDHPGSMIGDEAVRRTLAGALHLTFAAMFVVAVLTLLLAILVPAVSLRRAAQVAAAD